MNTLLSHTVDGLNRVQLINLYLITKSSHLPRGLDPTQFFGISLCWFEHFKQIIEALIE